MSTVTFTGLILGILLGMRHALEPDHIAAVSTLVLDSGDSRRGLVLGAFWGVGHSLSLLVVGFALAILHAELPGWLGRVFELGVAVMLLWLGVRSLGRAVRARQPHTHSRWLASRPLLYGVVHGLAGSGALTALVVAELPSTGSRLAYIGLFGFGSIVGMALLSGLAGWPIARLGRRRSAAAAISVLTGSLSAGLGAVILWRLIASA
jgi:hypothetical protein